MLIHFLNWSSRFDAWFDLTEAGSAHKIRPLGRHTDENVAREEAEAAEEAFEKALADCATPLYVHRVATDGNCLFRSVAHQVQERGTARKSAEGLYGSRRARDYFASWIVGAQGSSKGGAPTKWKPT